KRAGIWLKVWCDDDFRENLADRLCERLCQRAVADDDTTERRLFVGRESFVPGSTKIRVATNATRIRVLQNSDGWFGELVDQLRTRRDVEDVIERQLLTVELLEIVVEVTIKRGVLVRVLTVAETGGNRE